MSRAVKRAFKYRFYPSPAQAADLARTFGCVRLVYNMALQARSEAWTLREERVGYNATSAMLTAWKQTDDPAFLNEVSSVPLQQALRHLQAAFTNFWAKRANAARNILAEGLSVIACGGGVRPQRESSRTGQSSVKQETQRATAGTPRV
ncbi:transposase [Dactylosporangium sp. NPDC005572]|uniref:transposase n=1 Tax=Dactylosporangium sp. NPDC005572 TaxID=3156889 RepID=UPI0033A626E9